MSGARMDGHMPRAGQILGVLDVNARLALREAAAVTLPLVKQEAPGALGDVMRASTRRTATGYRATIATPPKKKYRDGEATAAQVVRWVNRGTGIYRKGPGPKKRIQGKVGRQRLMRLPGGHEVRFVRGQKPNPFIARAEAKAIVPVERVLWQGMQHAADDLRKLQHG